MRSWGRINWSHVIRWVLVVLLAFGSIDVSEAATKRRKVKKKKRPRAKVVRTVDHRIDFDLLSGGVLRAPTESTYNPGNSVFGIERSGCQAELNLDYRMTWRSKHKLVVRPRGRFEYLDIKKTDPTRSEYRSKGEVDLIETFGEAWLSDQVSLTVGLQNFQWGPAEIIAPSNPLFHFDLAQRSILWRERGRSLIRMNWTPSAVWSHVLMVEPINNGEPSFIAERDFSPKALFKTEVRGKVEARDYFGLTGGFEEEARPFGGLYFNWMASDGLAFYADTRFTQDAFYYVPEARSFLNYDMREAPEKGWRHLGVYGVRWETDAADIRAEAIVNPSGYDELRFQQSLQSTLPFNPNAAVNALRAFRPGLELRGKYYGYLSVRLPDLGAEGSWQMSLRYLHSGLDSSGNAGFSLEREMGNNFVFLSEGRHAIHKKDAEFGLQEKYYLFVGVRALW